MGVRELATELVRIPTVNSENAERVFELIFGYLEGIDYEYEIITAGNVKNLLVWRGKPRFALNAHYDVVPAGGKWTHPPFSAVQVGDFLYGRGAADDKGPLAALVEAFKHLDDVLLMVVGDEEKGGFHGTAAVIDKVKKFGITHALVAEPVSKQQFGDAVRKGRRGVLWLELVIRGHGGHASRVREILSPLKALPLLAQLTNYPFPRNPEMMETTLAITYVFADAGATNVIPAELKVKMDIRYNYAVKSEEIKSLLERSLTSFGYEVEMKELINAKPFLNQDSKYELLVSEVLSSYSGRVEFNTFGGSSDARFFSSAGISVLEVGPVPRNIHAADEHVSLSELELMSMAVVEIGSKIKNLER